MTEPVAQRISEAAVGRVTDPELRRPLSELDMVRGVETTPDEVTVSIVLTIVGCPAGEPHRTGRPRGRRIRGGGRPVRVEVGVDDARPRGRLSRRSCAVLPSAIRSARDPSRA